ncbi:uncharacterized protein LOC120634641, partial [Pararge aegeria]|uniref:uncharacterized protein LOC120634641 n=1 Tax=Pararge aegeria TaxID=116150 RepID=UPI0019D03703
VGRWEAWAQRARAFGRPANCPICPRPPSARPKRAASPRCRPWRRLDAQAWAARASSSSGAASTSSASCAPTVTPTPRSTTATTSSDRANASDAAPRQTDFNSALSWKRPCCDVTTATTELRKASWVCAHSDVASGVATSRVSGSRASTLSAASSWNGAHASDVTNGVKTACDGGSRASDTSWNIPEVHSASDSVCGRRTTACVQTVSASHRANVSASDVKSLSVPGMRPPLPVNAHHHRNDFFNHPHKANLTNIVPNMPAHSLSAQNHVPHNGGRINFNSHACNNVPNWSRSVDILKALHHAVPHNSSSHVDDRSAYAEVRQPSSARRPIFDIYAVPGEAKEPCHQNRDVVNQNSNPIYYRSKPKEANSSCTCVPISIPRVSSWSFTKKSVASTPIATNQAMNNMIKIQSADNIRRLQFINASIPSTSGQLDFDRTIYPPNNNENSAIYRHQTMPQEVVCHQPRENKNVPQIPIPLPMPSNKTHVHPNSAKNSVVHWTNSVENRVCCPETVLYGAVYGLKCLK